MTKSDGLDQIVNLANVVDIVAEESFDRIYNTTTGDQFTDTPSYRVRLHMVDNREIFLQMGEQTGDGALWVNTLVGANLAVADIEAAR